MELDKKIKETLNLPEISQICIVVRDLNKAVTYYENVLGLGPFVCPEINYTDVCYYGKPVTAKWIMAFCSLGPIEMELAQPVSGPNIYQDFLEERGEGIHHLGFDVRNLDERIEQYKKMGIGILQSGHTPYGGFARLDTTQTGGVIFEIIQRKSRRV